MCYCITHESNDKSKHNIFRKLVQLTLKNGCHIIIISQFKPYKKIFAFVVDNCFLRNRCCCLDFEIFVGRFLNLLY